MKNPHQSSIGGELRIKVLADADMVLELFINRKEFVEDAEKLLMEMAQSQQIEVYVTEKCLKRIRLELGDRDDQLGKEAAYKVEAMLNGRIIPIDHKIRDQARESSLKDFDSAEELAYATAMQLDAIITLNPQNFDRAALLIRSVKDLGNILELEKKLEKPYLPCRDSLVIYQMKLTQVTNLSTAKPREADLNGNISCTVYQSTAKLREAGLYGTDWHGVDLAGVDLSGVNLYAVNLYGANLCEADLSGANLCDADLSGANLYEADLSGANLCEADLSGANLSKARVCNARFRKNLGLSTDIILDLKHRGAIILD